MGKINAAFCEELAERLGFETDGQYRLQKFIAKDAIQRPWKITYDGLKQDYSSGVYGKIVLQATTNAVQHKDPKYHSKPEEFVGVTTLDFYVFFVVQVMSNLQKAGEIWHGSTEEDLPEIAQTVLNLLKFLRNYTRNLDIRANRVAKRHAQKDPVDSSVNEDEEYEEDEDKEPTLRKSRLLRSNVSLHESEDEEHEEPPAEEPARAKKHTQMTSSSRGTLSTRPRTDERKYGNSAKSSESTKRKAADDETSLRSGKKSKHVRRERHESTDSDDEPILLSRQKSKQVRREHDESENNNDESAPETKYKVPAIIDLTISKRAKNREERQRLLQEELDDEEKKEAILERKSAIRKKMWESYED